jgi:spore maturation protein SpmA
MIGVIAAIVLFFVLLGFLLSLPVAIPRVRAGLSSNQTARISAATVLGTTSLIVSSVLFARFGAGLKYTSQTLGYDPWYEPHKGILANSDAIIEEVWL